MQFSKKFIIFVLLFAGAIFLSINSQFVEISLLPNLLNLTNVVIHLPLYIVILVFTGIGLLLGTIFEYSRASKNRKDAQKNLIQARRLNAESKNFRSSTISEADEILGLLK